jgi:hypothetical protein
LHRLATHEGTKPSRCRKIWALSEEKEEELKTIKYPVNGG